MDTTTSPSNEYTDKLSELFQTVNSHSAFADNKDFSAALKKLSQSGKFSYFFKKRTHFAYLLYFTNKENEIYESNFAINPEAEKFQYLNEICRVDGSTKVMHTNNKYYKTYFASIESMLSVAV